MFRRLSITPRTNVYLGAVRDKLCTIPLTRSQYHFEFFLQVQSGTCLYSNRLPAKLVTEVGSGPRTVCLSTVSTSCHNDSSRNDHSTDTPNPAIWILPPAKFSAPSSFEMLRTSAVSNLPSSQPARLIPSSSCSHESSLSQLRRRLANDPVHPPRHDRRNQELVQDARSATCTSSKHAVTLTSEFRAKGSLWLRE